MPVGPTAYAAPMAYQEPLRTPSPERQTGIGLAASGQVGATVGGEATHSRVAGMLLIAGGVLAALKLMGFRFNVGVS
jgi:hypothetical protein